MAQDEYDPIDFPPFAVTTDLVALTVTPPQVLVLLVRRGEPPFEGSWALPGGFVGPDVDLDDAALAKLADKTGVAIDTAHLEQLQTFGHPSRDPRMRVVSVAYLAMVADPDDPDPGLDAAWVPLSELASTPLAFDHASIIEAGVARARAKLSYTTLATAFCAPEFSIAELRAVYETAWGVELDPANFHRKLLATEGLLDETGERRNSGKGRPSKLYRAGPATTIHPSLQP